MMHLRLVWTVLFFMGAACKHASPSLEREGRAIDARLQVAADQLWAGRREDARGVLASVLKDAPMDPGALLLQTCLALEDGALDEASRSAARHPELPEFRVLAELVEQRRQTPTPGWTEALVQAWKSAGRPSLEDAISFPETSADAKGLAQDVWERTESVEPRFVAVLADHASEAQQQWLLAHLPELQDPSLLSPAYDFFNVIGGPLREPALAALKPRLVTLANGADEARLSLLLMMDETSPDAPLTLEELAGLERLASLPRYRGAALSRLYADAEQHLKGVGATPRPIQSFMAAVWGLSMDETLVLRKRAKASKDHLSSEDRVRLGRALFTLGARIAEGTTTLERAVGFQQMEDGAELMEEEGKRARARRDLEHTRSAGRASRQLQVEHWPLPSLQREWMAAQVADEWTLLSGLIEP
ncbi:hypothetical protein [Corallococcus carmarthensis]|uniref:Uncharacterized protein n=1 Tax=Corallococcus carmarthensis TaxID=2316728 RepID=A0A3A8KDU8_9BACT|nr:hypothetical protein [Corallococcus carmarthensis]NOK16382.1 hypothetical protein [Corallococcus carmarthensis]RKH06333.1 hypothetical protein D7X32_05205 [Corallococcus carmarthensis]